MQRRIKSKVVIYGAWCICHPDRGIYYVGQTIRGVVSRWTTHLWCSRTEHSKSYSARGASPSAIFYRFYLEDLTLSGRTWAEVDALDARLFASAFAPGGRYYADTFTDPATIP